VQKRVPVYNTMFSDLHHYPRYEVRLDTVDPVPRFIARQWRGQQAAQNAALRCQRLIPFCLHIVDSILKIEDCLIVFYVTGNLFVFKFLCFREQHEDPQVTGINRYKYFRRLNFLFLFITLW